MHDPPSSMYGRFGGTYLVYIATDTMKKKGGVGGKRGR